jgi:hypothetical protein
MDAGLGSNPIEKIMRNLRENTCPIPCAWITPLRTTVSQILKYLKALFDNVMGFLPFDVGNKPNPATIMLVTGVVEALG